jgi:hypothetical protein
MILAAVIALKAYSILATHQQCDPNATLNLSQEVLSAGMVRVDELENLCVPTWYNLP